MDARPSQATLSIDVCRGDRRQGLERAHGSGSSHRSCAARRRWRALGVGLCTVAKHGRRLHQVPCCAQRRFGPRKASLRVRLPVWICEPGRPLAGHPRGLCRHHLRNPSSRAAPIARPNPALDNGQAEAITYIKSGCWQRLPPARARRHLRWEERRTIPASSRCAASASKDSKRSEEAGWPAVHRSRPQPWTTRPTRRSSPRA
jgi:hypothetical protein